VQPSNNTGHSFGITPETSERVNAGKACEYQYRGQRAQSPEDYIPGWTKTAICQNKQNIEKEDNFYHKLEKPDFRENKRKIKRTADVKWDKKHKTNAEFN